MNNTPTVSIIVPCYNHARFLPERLRSIKEQTFTDFEVILLDDASSDDSQAIMKAFANHEARVTAIDFNVENGGCVNDQWIKGVNLAKGEFVWIAESDDISSVTFLETLLAQFKHHQDIAMAYSDSWIVNEQGKPLYRHDYTADFYNTLWKRDFVIDGATLIKDYLVFKNVIPNVSAVLFKKQHLKAALKKSTMKYCGDWMCYIRILADASVAYVHEPLNLFRAHSQSTRWHNEQSYKRALLEKRMILKEIKKMALPESGPNILKSLKTLFNNRHKFKRISKLYTRVKRELTPQDNVALYGCNDVSEYLVVDLSLFINFSVIFDSDVKKQGSTKGGVAVTKLNGNSLNNIDAVIICSFAYADEMRASLEKLAFEGVIITL